MFALILRQLRMCAAHAMHGMHACMHVSIAITNKAGIGYPTFQEVFPEFNIHPQYALCCEYEYCITVYN